MAFTIVKDFVKFCRELRRKKGGKPFRSGSSKHQYPASTPTIANYPQSPDKDSPPCTAADQTLQNLPCSTTNHDDAQAIRLASKTAEIVTEFDTNKLHPSRSTTGSESFDQGDDPRRSICSDHSQPITHRCVESSAINHPSQLQTPPLEHHPSDISARKKYYAQDWDRIIPRKVLCYLNLVFDGKKISKRKRISLDWQEDGSYEIVNTYAQQCLRDSPETINKKVSRTDGVCKLFREEQECSSKPLETKDQWFEVLHRIIAEFVAKPGNDFVIFHLEITWTYAAGDDIVAEDSREEYSKKIADLLDARMKPNWRKRKFIPQTDFNAIMSQSVIEHLINKDKSLRDLADSSSPDGPDFDKKQFIRNVASSHKHLLALCVYEELPLICLWQMIDPNAKPVTFPLEDSHKPQAAEKRKFDNLLIKQWYFTAYQFPKPTDAKVHCIPLTDDDVIPIEACGEVKPIGRGGSKNVYKVKIQPGHHRFTADKTSVFALKEFRNGCPFEDFERESKVLRKLLNVPHPHITPHYASWSQAEHFFMLSPLATCNLKVYWKDIRPRLDAADFVLWQLRQLRGLADGLRHIYNLGGWHHDLKGENLLVFEEGDCSGPTLKIADFGSAKIHARRSGPRDGSNPTKSYYQGTSAYEAPDYIIRGETSRPYDVWTLGCIFLEMLTWTFGSHPSDLDTFSNARRRVKGGRMGSDTMFWYTDFDGRYYTTHWKPAVRKQLKTLEEGCNSAKGRAVFKELVLTTSKMLRMDPSARPKPYEVYNDMDRMTLWAEEALKKPDWNIQNLLIGATPSTTKSEKSGESDGDGVPVRASGGHMMMEQVGTLAGPFCPVLNAITRPPRDGVDLNFMGLRENLDLERSTFELIVQEVDGDPDGNSPGPADRHERPLYGSHLISPDRDAFGEARTVVSSAVASEFHLPPKPRLSIPFERREGLSGEASGGVRRRFSFS